jgi:hypothetical protein
LKLIEHTQVLWSYTVEAILATLYFIAINFSYVTGRYPFVVAWVPAEIRRRFSQGLWVASEGLLDSALFFSFAISCAGWVSLHGERSYYEYLVFFSANILAVSALFVFLAMFIDEGLEKRGRVLIFLLLAILLQGAVEFIVFRTKSTDKWPDYQCLQSQFQDEGYRPGVFEDLFFVLVVLSILAGFTKFLHDQWGKKYRHRGVEDPPEMAQVKLWVFGARIVVQTIANVVVLVELVYIWKIRHIMARIAGPSWQEGSWGFGQILALFFWLPSVLDILCTLGESRVPGSEYIRGETL